MMPLTNKAIVMSAGVLLDRELDGGQTRLCQIYFEAKEEGDRRGKKKKERSNNQLRRMLVIKYGEM